MSALRRTLRQAAREPGEEIESKSAGSELSRRELLAGIATTSLLAACGGARPAARRSPAGTRVVIVGAGAAGLHCAHRLVQAGLDPIVYEASSRVGGRIFSARNYGDQVVELGGELIDSDHFYVHALCNEFDLQLDDLRQSEAGLEDTFWFGNRAVGEEEIAALFRPLARRMAKELALSETHAQTLSALDRTSLADWLRASEVDPLLAGILSVAYVGEYGLEADEQSALNLLYLIDHESTERMRVFGASDERYRIHRGNDTLISSLQARVGDRIEAGCALVRLVRSADGRTRLSFDRDGQAVEVVADRVVLALPFSTLRRVDLRASGLSAAKQRAIAELGYGTNAKLMSRYQTRVWRDAHGKNGSAFTDTGIQATWDTSRGQAEPHGILTNFLGGTAGAQAGSGSPEDQVRAALPHIDAMFPGAGAAYIEGSALRMHWPSAPFQRGSYACYRPGQWALAGVEGAQEGNLHFAGEHTSSEYQGFMEGALESGARAAKELLDAVGIPGPGGLEVLLPLHASKSRRSVGAAV